VPELASAAPAAPAAPAAKKSSVVAKIRALGAWFRDHYMTLDPRTLGVFRLVLGFLVTTGHGEGMIRLCIARAAVDAMRAGRSVEDALRGSISTLLTRIGSTGGVIAVDRGGRFGIARSTETMSWAAAWDGGEESGI
jgi:asparaginase